MYPRANTLGLLIKDNYILLEEQEGKHSKGIGYYYRPIGGTIELGEMSNETLLYNATYNLDSKRGVS